MKQNKKIILGSQSPRRQSLLKGLGVEFKIDARNIDETFPPDLPPFEVPEYLAKLKAEPFISEIKEDEVVITSDTVVVLRNKIMGKPADETDALSMILELSGNTHHVVTGVNFLFHDRSISFSSFSEVEFENISKKEAEHYIDIAKPFDKAGAYGIQEWIGYTKIKRINGCYYNIMGFPLNPIYNHLIEEKIIEI